MNKLKVIFTNLKSEYMKIIFPSNEQVVRDSVNILISSVVIGLIIFGLDSVIGFGLGFIFK